MELNLVVCVGLHLSLGLPGGAQIVNGVEHPHQLIWQWRF
ncbi:hypothetical protein M758_3G126400 [Ceratodon purpureus]|nr:hypothetical protein M758_3G126400 [Ceratodon purpureus]